MLSVIALNTSGAGLPKVLLPAPSADTNGRETEHWQTRFAVAPALIAEWNWKSTPPENGYSKKLNIFHDYHLQRLSSDTFFFAKAYYKVGQPAEYTIDEVAQRWIAPNGKFETIARLRGIAFIYYDLWQEGSSMEIRRNHRVYDITPACTYPRIRVIPELKRNGFKGEFHNLQPFELFCELLKNNQAETLIKRDNTVC